MKKKKKKVNQVIHKQVQVYLTKNEPSLHM